MNCHSAKPLLSAERDGPLPPGERAALEAHVGGCADCRRERVNVAAAIEGWRGATMRVAVPDAGRAWQDIRREIRRNAPEKNRVGSGGRRWAISLSATAALVLAAVLAPRWFENTPSQKLARLETARADFVEVGKDSSSMVYVDDKSGWLVVWTVNDKM